MKILFLSPADDIHTARWVNELTEKGHNVYLVFCKNHAPTVHKIDNCVNLIKLPFSSGIGYYLNSIFLRRIYKRLKPCVVNAHYASGYGTLARKAGLEHLVLSVWGSDVYDFPYKSKFNMDIIKKNIIYANKIASTSYAMAEQVRKLINDDINITITPFGVDTDKFKVKEIYNNTANFQIGIVKKVSEKYGIKYLIQAIKVLIDDLITRGNTEIAKKIMLLIYGDGDQKEEMERLCANLNIEKQVRFMGRIPNDKVPEALSNLDIFVLSSILDSESFGVAAVEAMSVGIPVVATDVDGFKEVVEHEVTGIIVERKNPQALANALMRLILDEELRISMGNSGRKRVQKLYKFSDNVDMMIELYQELSV